MELKKGGLKHVFWLNFASILRNFYGIVRAKATAVFLGVLGVGILGQILTFYTVQNRIGSVGLDALLINRLGKLSKEDKSGQSYFIFNALLLLIIINLIFVVTISLFNKVLTKWIFVEDVYTKVMFLLIFLTPFYSIFYIFETITQANTDFKSLVRGRNIANISGLASIIPLIYLWKEMGIILSLYVFVFSGGVYFVFVNKDLLSRFSFKYFNNIKKFLFDYLQIGLTDLSRKVLVVISLMFFRIWIVQFLGIKQNGLFQAVWSILYYPDIFIGAFGTYFFPIISKAINKDELKGVINTNLEYLLFLMFPIVTIVMLFPDIILVLLYNKDFLQMALYLRLVMFFKFFESIYIMYNLTFLAQTKLKAFITTESIRSLILIGFSYISIRGLGLPGAILSIVIMQIASIMVMFYFIIKNPNFHFSKDLLNKILVFVFLLAILFIPLEFNVILRIIKISIFLILFLKMVGLGKYKSGLLVLFRNN